jgi:cytochrome c1
MVVVCDHTNAPACSVSATQPAQEGLPILPRAGAATSSAMKEAGFVWDEEKLDRFIANPDQVVPGDSMKPYGGLSSSDDRKNIIAFLAQQQ